MEELDDMDIVGSSDGIDDLINALDRLPVEDLDQTATAPQLLSRRSIGESRPDISLESSRDDIESQLQNAVRTAEPKVQEVQKETKSEEEEEVGFSDRRLTSESMLQIAYEVFGEDRVSAQSRWIILIHFPEIVITNTNGLIHKIRDLYVQLHIDSGNMMLTMSGVRTTLTPKEASVHYGHSHLRMDAAKGLMTPFCLGSSCFKAIATNFQSNPTEAQWEFLLMSIERYLQWESLEGGPYVRIEKMMEQSEQEPINYEVILEEIAPFIPIDTFKMIENHLIFGSTSEFNNICQEYSPVRHIRSAGNSNLATCESRWRNDYSLRLQFKGTTIPMKFVQDENPVEENDIVDPEIILLLGHAIKSKLITFNKLFNNEYVEYRYGRHLGKTPSFQSADISHYREVARQNRAIARKSRKQGMVGRTDNPGGG